VGSPGGLLHSNPPRTTRPPHAATASLIFSAHKEFVIPSGAPPRNRPANTVLNRRAAEGPLTNVIPSGAPPKQRPASATLIRRAVEGPPEADHNSPEHKSRQRGESVAKRPTREPARKSMAMRSKPPFGPKRKRRATAKEPGFSLASTASQRTRPSGPVRSVEIVRIVDGRRDLNHIV
jgi:hypothetical protein